MTIASPTTSLDVRTIPPHERHATIFGCFDALSAGETMEIVNDHDPRPLYYQLQSRAPGDFSWHYLASGPEVWHVSIAKLGGAPSTGGCCGSCGGGR